MSDVCATSLRKCNTSTWVQTANQYLDHRVHARIRALHTHLLSTRRERVRRPPAALKTNDCSILAREYSSSRSLVQTLITTHFSTNMDLLQFDWLRKCAPVLVISASSPVS